MNAINTEQFSKAAFELGVELPPRTPSLSMVLEALSMDSAGMPRTVEELQTALKDRAVAILLLSLSLPFCFIPVPGLSTPFGVVVLLMGIRIMFGQEPRLPGFIRQRRISPSRLSNVLSTGIRFAGVMEKVAKPRMQFLHRWPGAMNLIGFGITAGGLLLMLPLPIPFSNILPAWAVVFLAAGMMERDGLMVLFGHVLTVLAWVFVVLAWFLGAKGIQKLFILVSGE